MIVANTTGTRPRYTYIILGQAGGYLDSNGIIHVHEDAYYTRAGGYLDGRWIETNGHYDMSIHDAISDFQERIERGF